eukprot:gene23333-biopygen7994
METPNIVADFHGARFCVEDLPTTKTLNATKIANAAGLDRHEHDASTAATRVVSAREVFVSRPDSGEPYAGHPRAAEYAKGLELLAEDPNRQYHFLMTLLMVGDGGVGKSSYLLRLTDDRFTHEYLPTMDVDFKIVHRGFCDPVLPRSMERSLVGVKLQIWGTAGRTIPVSSFRGASGYFVFFDVSDRESFESIPRWVSEMQRYGREDAPAVLIGMKQDIAWPDEAASSGLPSGGMGAAIAATAGDVNGRCSHREQCRQVSYDEGLAMAQQFDMPYVECSAKDNALATLVYHIMRSRADFERRTQDHIFGRYSPRPSGDVWASKGVVKLLTRFFKMEAPNIAADFHGDSSIEDLPTTKTLNATKTALDRHEHDASTAATRVVSAREVFVSRPDSGEPYAGHPRAAEYAKGLELLADDPNHQYHIVLKLLLLGDGGVGKSSYLLRLTDNIFPQGYMPTLGVDFKIVYRGFCNPVLPLSMERSPVGVKLQIWDTAGQERFRTISSTSYRGTSGYFMLFDVSDRGSLANVPRWVSEMRRYGREDAPAVLIGMKQDIAWPGEAASSRVRSGGKDAAADRSEMNGYYSSSYHAQRQVSYDEGLAMALLFDMPYLECSAKDNVHIEDALATLVYHIMRSRADLQRGVQENVAACPSGPKGNGETGVAAESRRQCVVS